MKNKKLLTITLSLMLLIEAAITVQAVTITSSQINLFPDSNFYASSMDHYTAVPSDGYYKETHKLTGGTYPNSFKAVLELRTAWYSPNQIRDTSSNPNGWNASNFVKDQQFRTVMTITNTYKSSGYSLTYSK